MVFEIGVNLRVTECLNKGERNYMEDFSKCYFEKIDGSIVFGYFGIFDGHGGSEAACFAKKYLINEIKKINDFWSDNDDDVLNAIKQGFFNTHQLMWNERDKWAKTVSGFDSTAGTTATISIVRNKKLYIGHVGDSACVLGSSKAALVRTDFWESQGLTVEHKPCNEEERKRIENDGGLVAKKSGVDRVVWNRPKFPNKSSLTNNGSCDLDNTATSSVNSKPLDGDSSIEYDQVPFLAVTRSLGDLWSYDQLQGIYHISPEPDVQCIPLDFNEHRCIILGSDGLWNVVSNCAAVELVRICERETERRVFLDPSVNSNFFYNPAATLVKYAISQWKRKHIRADNVSALVVMIDPPGPSMTKRREDRRKGNFASLDLCNSFMKITSYESFSKALAKEFLIECNRWRSANESKDHNFDKFTISNAVPVLSTIHSVSSKDSQSISRSLASSRADDSKILSFLINDTIYSKFCLSWANNTKICNFLSEYFKSKGINSEKCIVNYFNTLESNVIEEILKIIPWIYAAKTSFKTNTRMYNTLNGIPLFSNFWLDLHRQIIKPLEACRNVKLQNMATIMTIIKPNISAMLKVTSQPKQTYSENSDLTSKYNNDMNSENLKYTLTSETVTDRSSLLQQFKPKDELCSSTTTLNKLNSYSLPKKNTLLKFNPNYISDKKKENTTTSLLKRSFSEKYVNQSTPKQYYLRNTQNSTDSDIVSRLSEINNNFRNRSYYANMSNSNCKSLGELRECKWNNKSIRRYSGNITSVKYEENKLQCSPKYKQNLIQFIMKRTLKSTKSQT